MTIQRIRMHRQRVEKEIRARRRGRKRRKGRKIENRGRRKARR